MSERRGWTVTRLPTGEVRIDLSTRRTWMRLAVELGLVAVGIGLALLPVLMLESLQALLIALALAAALSWLGIRGSLRRSPKAWVLSPGKATCEGRNGKLRAYSPARVIVETPRERPGSPSRTYLLAYGIFLETPQGRVAVSGGLPFGDRNELARAVADALGVELVEVKTKPLLD